MLGATAGPASAGVGATEPGSPTLSSSPAPASAAPSREYRPTGWFSQMSGHSGIRGISGELVTYRVEAEQGSGVTSREFAWAIDRTLSHERGWTAGGHWRFQRTSTGDPDLIIRLATPDTVDAQCGAAGFDTEGYTSCRAGQYVLINLDRWTTGVPHINDLPTYRRYLINHEVGHGLGENHEACPAAGSPAPVMLQQTLKLDGCRPNAYPRSKAGSMISGPPIP